MRNWMAVAMVAGLLSACSGPEGSIDGDETVTKEQARDDGGKSDDGTDWCDAMDWYGDGECDDFCIEPDPDCDANNGSANNGSTNNGSTNNGSTNNGSTNNSSTNNGSTNNGSTNNGSTNNRAGQCGGFGGLTCADTEWCDYPDDSICGAADELGTCVPRPEACDLLYAPVCGCDGNTYGNECEAQAAGVDVAKVGECGAPSGCTADSDCDPGEACVQGLCQEGTAGQCGGFGGLTCAADEFCDYADADMCGAADQLGVCQKRPDACTTDYNPVCGCDGQTYSNACAAHAAGTDAAQSGECGTTPMCSADADCAVGEICLGGKCVDGGSGGQCGGFAGLTCADTEWCDYPDDSICGAADQLGVCKPRPDACITLFDPVCGCDGMTYSNSCVANSAGVDVMAGGPCQF